MSVTEAVAILAALTIVGGALLKGVILILQRADTSAAARFDDAEPLAERRAGLEALDSGGVSLLSEADTRTLPILARITSDQAPAPTRRRRPLLDAFASGGMSLLLDESSSTSGISPSSDQGGGAPSAPVA